MRLALDAATLPPLVTGVELERAPGDGCCAVRQPPASPDSTRSASPQPGTGEGAPTARPSLPAAAPLPVSVSVSARPESRAEALIESRAEALVPDRVKESRRTRVDIGRGRFVETGDSENSYSSASPCNCCLNLRSRGSGFSGGRRLAVSREK